MAKLRALRPRCGPRPRRSLLQPVTRPSPVGRRRRCLLRFAAEARCPRQTRRPDATAPGGDGSNESTDVADNAADRTCATVSSIAGTVAFALVAHRHLCHALRLEHLGDYVIARALP